MVMVVSKKCSVPDCEGKHYAKGLCEKHYRRWKRGPGHWKSYLDVNHCLFCQDAVYAKGLCKNHYQQWQRGVDGRKLRNYPDIAWYGPDIEKDRPD